MCSIANKIEKMLKITKSLGKKDIIQYIVENIIMLWKYSIDNGLIISRELGECMSLKIDSHSFNRS